MKLRKLRPYLIWSVVLLVIGFLIKIMFFPNLESFIEIQTEEIKKEKLIQEVSATGTINPIEMVEVGTQVSGIISEIFVDFNDKVSKGQIIAKMDMQKLLASIKESKANLEQIEIVLNQSKLKQDQAKEFYSIEAISLIDYENAQNTYENNKALYNIAKLRLERDQVNLSFATIVSPIDGIIISRDIEVGQTVAASFSTPRLFTIANDLSKMKIEASVDEADIGQVKKGQTVTFSVDTYIEEKYSGIIEQVQLNPVISSNVVTYNVIVLIDNTELKLIPGMTATLLIKTNESDEMNTIPNAAFSFGIDSLIKETLIEKGYSIKPIDSEEKTIWLKKENTLQEVNVTAHFTDGLRSAVTGDFEENDILITDIEISDGQEGSSFFNGNNNNE